MNSPAVISPRTHSTVPNTTTIKALEDKFAHAAQESVANYSFYIGATNDNLAELKAVDYSDASGEEARELPLAEAAGEAVKEKDSSDDSGGPAGKTAALSRELYALAEKLRQWAGKLKGEKSR